MDTRQFARAIKRKNMAKALGVGHSAIHNAIVRGAFPPSWYLVAKELADRAGIDCPPDLFSMRRMSDESEESMAAQDRVAAIYGQRLADGVYGDA